jgi:hypothetical protein
MGGTFANRLVLLLNPLPQQKALQLSVAETKAWFLVKERRGFDFEIIPIEVKETNERSACIGGVSGDVYSWTLRFNGKASVAVSKERADSRTSERR